MSGFVEGEDRRQQALLPRSLEDYVGEDNPARVVDVFVDELDLEATAAPVATDLLAPEPAPPPTRPAQ
jgi:transposase